MTFEFRVLMFIKESVTLFYVPLCICQSSSDMVINISQKNDIDYEECRMICSVKWHKLKFSFLASFLSLLTPLSFSEFDFCIPSLRSRYSLWACDGGVIAIKCLKQGTKG